MKRLRENPRGLTFKRTTWSLYKPGGDHDHCEFCTEKFAGPEIPNVLRDGYMAKDTCHWACKPCFRGLPRDV